MPTTNTAPSVDTYQGTELGLSLLNGVILIAKRRRVLAAFLAISLALGLVVSVLTRPYYTATVAFLPPQQNASSASSMLAQLGNLGAIGGMSGGSFGLKSTSDLYAGLLQSQTVADAIIQRFGLAAEYRVRRLSAARKVLGQNTTIDAKQKDGIIRLSVTDRSAQQAAALANGYIEQLQRMSGTLAVTEAAQRRLFLEQQLQETREKLASAEEALTRTEQTTGVLQVEGQAKALIESAAGLRAQVAAKEVQVESMRTYAGQGNPDLLQAQQELAGLREQLAKLNGKTSGAGIGGSEKGQLANAGLEYTRRLRDAKYQESMFEIIARQYEAAKMDEAREGALIQVVDRANAPDYKAGPRRLVIILGFLLGGVAAALLYILIAQAFSVLFNRPEYRVRLLSLKAALGMQTHS